MDKNILKTLVPVNSLTPENFKELAPKPRQYTGTAKTPVTIARVDSALLDRLVTWDQATGYEVMEFDGSQDPEWMMRMLRNETFLKLPPSNINALFARSEPVEVKASQVIIRQGDPGDFYYLIKSGKASGARKTDQTGKVAVVGQLNEGDGFGEEGLLSGG